MFTTLSAFFKLKSKPNHAYFTEQNVTDIYIYIYNKGVRSVVVMCLDCGSGDRCSIPVWTKINCEHVYETTRTSAQRLSSIHVSWRWAPKSNEFQTPGKIDYSCDYTVVS